MKPVEQTAFGAGRGNCFSACLASILELGIEEVPSFCDTEQDADGSNWLDRAATWLRTRGFGLLFITWDAAESGLVPLNCWVICCGKQRGGEEHHAIVGFTYTGKAEPGDRPNTYRREWQIEQVFDPNPKRTFLEAVESMLFVVPGYR